MHECQARKLLLEFLECAGQAAKSGFLFVPPTSWLQVVGVVLHGLCFELSSSVSDSVMMITSLPF